MRKTGIIVIVASMCIAGFIASESFAWDFRIKAAFDWKYEYYSQLGDNGFFGPYDVSNFIVGLPVESRSNTWLGLETNYGLFQGQHPGVVSGSDASLQAMKMEIDTVFQLNKAVTVNARYRIGGSNVGNNDLTDDSWPFVGPGFHTQYFNSIVPGQNNPQAYGEWTMLWATAVTPWGTISFGKKPFAVGCGLQYSAEDLTEESLLVKVPYGPFQFNFGFYPMTLGHVDFFDMPRRWTDARIAQWFVVTSYYQPSFSWDKSGHPNKLMAFLSYAAGPLKIGMGTQFTSLHFGTEGGIEPEPFNEFPTLDQTDWEGWVYTKYSNGRFFFNTEVDFFHRIRTFQRTRSGDIFGFTPILDGGGSAFAPQYVESWKWMIETGVLAGPSKLSLLCAYLPGPDRRHGVLIDRQPTTYPVIQGGNHLIIDYRDQAVNLNRHVGNVGVFRPYSLLFAYDYGSGLNCHDLNGNGCVTDATILAGRLDYALAANLNVYCSFLWAQRASHAWQLGSIFPLDRDLMFTPIQSVLAPQLDFIQPVPTVPDTDLGWEIDMGGQWKLLENLLLSVTAAYWQPGRWFNFACVDRSIPNWGNPNQANNWSTTPDRTIDPILGLQINAIADF